MHHPPFERDLVDIKIQNSLTNSHHTISVAIRMLIADLKSCSVYGPSHEHLANSQNVGRGDGRSKKFDFRTSPLKRVARSLLAMAKFQVIESARMSLCSDARTAVEVTGPVKALSAGSRQPNH